MADRGVKYVFGLTGAHILHVIDSIYREPRLRFIPCAHEQGAAFAADAYARISGEIGVAVATSGPGAINLISGACSAYFDAVPLLLLTGQVVSTNLKGNRNMRQYGFQETEIPRIYAPITKYARTVTNAEMLPEVLQEAFMRAMNPRPGPVLLDLPDDIQRSEISFISDVDFVYNQYPIADLSKLYNQFAKCSRPVLIVGAGIHQAKAENEIVSFIETLKMPVVTSWGGKDILPFNHPLNIGVFGTCGSRYANFAIQTADLLLVLGARLNSQKTGPRATFAPKAIKIGIDIEEEHLEDYDLPFESDLKSFCRQFVPTPLDISDWWKRIESWKWRYPLIKELPSSYDISPYIFLFALSSRASGDEVVITDAGATLAWTMQAFRGKGQRIISSFNHSPMGYALPGSIGASLAKGQKVLCITGDGSFRMNPQELATIKRWNLPIKIFVLDNQGYGIIRQTQDTWLEGRHFASNFEGGLGNPNLKDIALAYGIDACEIKSDNDFHLIQHILDSEGPYVAIVKIDPQATIMPKLGKGKSIADLWPEIDSKILEEEIRC